MYLCKQVVGMSINVHQCPRLVHVSAEPDLAGLWVIANLCTPARPCQEGVLMNGYGYQFMRYAHQLADNKMSR